MLITKDMKMSKFAYYIESKLCYKIDSKKINEGNCFSTYQTLGLNIKTVQQFKNYMHM